MEKVGLRVLQNACEEPSGSIRKVENMGGGAACGGGPALCALLSQDDFSLSSHAVDVQPRNFLHGSSATKPVLINAFVLASGKEGEWFLLFALNSVFTGSPSCYQDLNENRVSDTIH